MPNKSQLRIDKILSNISVKYTNRNLIADEIFPRVPVKMRTDRYRVYQRNFRLPDTLRADNGLSRQHSFDVSLAAYSLQLHSLKDYVGMRDAENYDAADLRADTVENLTDTILLRKEKSVADLFTTTNWSLNVSLAATAAWNLDTTVSNPIPVVDTGTSTILLNSGNKPNYLVLNQAAHVGVKNHGSIIDRIKHTSREVTEDMIAALFSVDQYLVSRAVVDVSQPGLTESITSLWGDSAFLGWKPASPSPKAASAGYTFWYNQPPVKRWIDEERMDAEAIEVNIEYDCKIVSSLSGFLIKDVT